MTHELMTAGTAQTLMNSRSRCHFCMVKIKHDLLLSQLMGNTHLCTCAVDQTLSLKFVMFCV